MNGDFTLYTPTKVVFGRKTEEKAGELVRAFGGSRVLIHYGGSSAVRSGLIDRVKASLDQAGVFHVELGGVVPNPQLSKVYEGIELAKTNGVDFLLAVGGGSVIDSAKAIAYALAEPEYDVKELYEHTRTAKACYPIGTILTIAASGSEMSDSSVISYEDKKRGYNSDLCRPKFAIMDPELTMTLPKWQLGAGAADIFMHTSERYFANILGNHLAHVVRNYMRVLCCVRKVCLALGNFIGYRSKPLICFQPFIEHRAQQLVVIVSLVHRRPPVLSAGASSFCR